MNKLFLHFCLELFLPKLSTFLDLLPNLYPFIEKHYTFLLNFIEPIQSTYLTFEKFFYLDYDDFPDVSFDG